MMRLISELWPQARSGSDRVRNLIAISGTAAALVCGGPEALRAEERAWDAVVTPTATAVAGQGAPTWAPQRIAQRSDAAAQASPPTEPIQQPPVPQVVPGPVADPGLGRPEKPAGEVKPDLRQNGAPEVSAEPGRKPVDLIPGPGAPAQGPLSLAPPSRQQKPPTVLPPDARLAQQYCVNIADPAADARFAWQAKTIADFEKELDKRVALLDAKTEELKAWMARRDEFSNKAQDKLVGLYSRMRPDAAALQLAAMDEITAAALVTKLEPKSASAVLNEMETERAARIAAIIAGAAKVPERRAAKPAPEASANPPGDGSPPSPPNRTKS